MEHFGESGRYTAIDVGFGTSPSLLFFLSVFGGVTLSKFTINSRETEILIKERGLVQTFFGLGKVV
jgi:hypothetical protein